MTLDVFFDANDAAWEAAASRHDEAIALFAECRLDEAEAVAREAATALGDAVGEQHPDYGNALDTLGSIVAARGRPSEAEQLFRRALAIYDCFRDEAVVDPLRLSVLTHLSYQLSMAGCHVEAVALAREALALSESLHDAGDPAIASFHNNLGVALKLAGRYAEAQAAYGLAESIGAGVTAALLHNLAGLSCSRGDFVAAEGFARRAVEAREDSDDFGIAMDLAGLGDALAGQGRALDAEACYREALELYVACGQAAHPEVAYAHHNLGDVLAELGRNEEARAAYRDSIARKIGLFGETHPEVAATMNNLAANLADCGYRAQARALSHRAVDIVAATLEADHPIRLACDALAHALQSSASDSLAVGGQHEREIEP